MGVGAFGDFLFLKRPPVPLPAGSENLPPDQLAALQAKILARAATLVKPGGHLVYCVCSIEPEEGETQIAALLRKNPDFRRVPFEAGECGLPPEFLTAEGDLRTLPCHWPDEDARMAGLDGFFAARLCRQG